MPRISDIPIPCGSHDVEIDGDATRWTYRRLDAPEVAALRPLLSECEHTIVEALTLVLKAKRCHADAELAREQGDEDRALDLTALGLTHSRAAGAHQLGADQCHAVVGWLLRVLIDVGGYTDASGHALSWAALSPSTRLQIAHTLPTVEGLRVLKAAAEGSSLSAEAKKKHEHGSTGSAATSEHLTPPTSTPPQESM